MTHLEMLKEILGGQMTRGVKNGDWLPTTEYETIKSIFHGCTEIKVESAKVIFIFNRNGQFVGMVNYQ
jgi:hypothetical protein